MILPARILKDDSSGDVMEGALTTSLPPPGGNGEVVAMLCQLSAHNGR